MVIHRKFSSYASFILYHNPDTQIIYYYALFLYPYKYCTRLFWKQ